MGFQGTFLRESAIALVTDERLFLQVTVLVISEVGVRCVRPRAEVALVRPFRGMR